MAEESLNNEEQNSSGERDADLENWRDIHEDFDEDYKEKWEKNGFDCNQTEQWIKNGLGIEEYELAAYAKSKNYNLSTIDLEDLRKEFCPAQNWLDWYYPENGTCIIEYDKKKYGKTREQIAELDISRQNLCGSLKLTGFNKLEALDCSENELTNLDLSDCTNLKRLKCIGNQLTSLDVSNLIKLETINCRDNQLASLNLTNCSGMKELNCSVKCLPNLDFLKTLPSENTEVLYLRNNNISSSDGLVPFSKFTKLRKLDLGNERKISNNFNCSLEPLKHLTKLEALYISNTDIKSGLEYLPESVQYLYCFHELESQVKIIAQELAPYYNPEEDKYDFPKWRDENVVKMVPTLPPSLTSEKENKLTESYDIKDEYYDDEIYPQTSREVTSSRNLLPEELPAKLYSIKDKKLTKERTNIKNYAILSYVWGDASKPENKLAPEEQAELDGVWGDLGYKNNVNRLGYKSWKKAIQALETINNKNKEELKKTNLSISEEELSKHDINHLWMDQLCINQSDNGEKATEVPKMGQYYSNAAVTLVGIQTKAKTNEEEIDLLDILKLITCSEWFSRSWTFQEGWLSKWTLFMFDDILVDGREMAALWVFQQPAHAGISFAKTEKGLKKVATPIGWVHYQKGYKPKDRVSLRLHEVLREIKSRGRGNPVDGIYSTLGLLPYGNDKEIKVDYKPRECSKCLGGVEAKDCQHDEVHKKWATYTTKDLEERLLHIMQIAIKNGYGEPLAWHGIGNGWLPQISDKGSTTIEGGIKIDYISQNKEEVIQKDGSLKIIGSEYIVVRSSETMSRWDQSSSIESGARERKTGVVVNDKEEEIELSGTKTLLSLMSKLVKEKNAIRLLIPNKNQWRSIKPFALLVQVENNEYYWLGLVEISEGAEKLSGLEEREIVIEKKLNIWIDEKEKEVSIKEKLQSEWKVLKEKIDKLAVQEQEELLAQIQVEVNKKI